MLSFISEGPCNASLMAPVVAPPPLTRPEPETFKSALDALFTIPPPEPKPPEPKIFPSTMTLI